MRAAPSCGGEQTGSPNTNAGRERIQQDRLKVAARRTHEERNEIILAPSARPQNGRDNNGTDGAAAARLCPLGGLGRHRHVPAQGFGAPRSAGIKDSRRCHSTTGTRPVQRQGKEDTASLQTFGFCGVVPSTWVQCPAPELAGSPRTLLAAPSWGEVGVEGEQPQYQSNKPQTNPAAQPTYLKPSTSQTIVNLAQT